MTYLSCPVPVWTSSYKLHEKIMLIEVANSESLVKKVKIQKQM